MDTIRTGADVFCGREKVGTVGRLIADSRDSRITDLVVDRGLLHAAKIVPLGQVQDVSAGAVHLALDKEQFEHADGFVDKKFQDPEGNWQAPPGYDRRDFLLNVEVAWGAGAGYGMTGKPSPFPPSPADPRPQLVRPSVKEGTPVVAANGEKVGEVGQLAFHSDDGRLTQLVLKRGLLGRDHVEIPLDWVADINEVGVVLRVPVAEVEQLRSTDA